MTWDDVYTCPHCNRDDLVLPSGPKKSPILIIGEFPGQEEVKKGRPMVGAMGGVFRTELARVGMDMRQCRLTNLWLHPSNKNDKCLEYGMEKCLKEARGRKAILLIGSTTVKFFCNQAVSTVTGLEVQSDYLSAPIIMACIQPATVFHQSVGELRLSLQKFSRRVKDLL